MSWNSPAKLVVECRSSSRRIQEGYAFVHFLNSNLECFTNDQPVEEAINSVTTEAAKPNLPVEIIADGLIPTAAQVEAVSTVVTAGTEIVRT